MARYLGPVCKLCRREGGKLYLKGERCFTEKCAVSRRPYPPGQHGQGRIKLSEYGLRLREKQKMRRIYGLLEKQFAAYYSVASHLKGPTGEEMLGLIERRLDNVVHRLGFASSRRQGRQLVRHSHILVNGRRVDIPSFAVSPGDKIEIREKSQKIAYVGAALAAAQGRQAPGWLDVDAAKFTGTVKSMPIRDELNEPNVREQYVVEYYSR
jgi:small subunit ribosomal protein S4